MNKIIKIISFFLVASFLLWFFFFKSFEDAVAPRLEEERSLADFSTEKRNISEEDATLMYEMDISYPYFTNDEFNQINQEIEGIIDDILLEFKDLTEMPLSNNFGLNNLELDVDYIIARNDGKIFSVEFIVYSVYFGAPRPITHYISLNYDMKEMKEIRIIDCFDNLIFLSEYVKGKLSNQLGENFFEDGADPLVENYDKFVIKNDRLEIIFDYFQVAPRTTGPVRANVNFSDFENQIKCDIY